MRVNIEEKLSYCNFVRKNRVVTSPSGIRNKKIILQSRFLHRVPPYISNAILSISDYGTIIKSFHAKFVSDSKSLLTCSSVIHTTYRQIAAEKANLPGPYKTKISEPRSSSCSSLHFYREILELVSSPSALPVE